MKEQPTTVAYRSVGEWVFESDRDYPEPFVDVVLDGVFMAPSGKINRMPGFYDGQRTWRVRFSPDEVGKWRYAVEVRPSDAALAQSGHFVVSPQETSGFLKSVPGEAWGFQMESGAPIFLMGDTVYNLFGAAHCGLDVTGFLERRAGQGFNIFRARMHVSPFHPPNGHSDWQTQRTWPWGGSEQSPRFDRFNLSYFRTVDEVVRVAEKLNVGFEMIMEAWGFEFPFNNRAVFVPEWEELWLRYLVARYDAFRSVYVWTLANEYEFYPDGQCRHSVAGDRWAMRVARWLKQLGPHGHVVAVHNGPQLPPFAERFALDPGAVDAVIFQAWGAIDHADAWLATGIEETIRNSFAGWAGSAIFAEYGYERNPDLPLTFPPFAYLDAEHNRRGAWRGAYCGMGIINGFENTWGPIMDLVHDQEGVSYFEHLRYFLTEVVPFQRLQPTQALLVEAAYEEGHRPLALASKACDIVAVYFPAGGTATLNLPNSSWTGRWYNPRNGALRVAELERTTEGWRVAAPSCMGPRPADWALVLFS